MLPPPLEAATATPAAAATPATAPAIPRPPATPAPAAPAPAAPAPAAPVPVPAAPAPAPSSTWASSTAFLRATFLLRRTTTPDRIFVPIAFAAARLNVVPASGTAAATGAATNAAIASDEAILPKLFTTASLQGRTFHSPVGASAQREKTCTAL
ncbi:hypothetical protein HY78_00610 [Rhizorhabdus wittichii DC-6]|nr:hypothetical protein HY78_00610 [Rhizorhabdus wittichii DC-6]